jgi:DNA-binding NarL/FixJ family response regulator
MPVDIEISAQGALIITEQGLVENSIALYTAFWKAAKPFGSAPRRRGNGLSEQEIHAIRFWAQGCTDSAVARKLGVSERTVRRISDKVTEKFGTTSRFQTGAWVVIEGIIDSGDLV